MNWVIDWWIFISQACLEAKIELCNFQDVQDNFYSLLFKLSKPL